MNRVVFLLIFLIVVAAPTEASWVLDGKKSVVTFVSTKATDVAEVHQFTNLSGGVDSNGNVNIMIGLASVDTGIELRDDRMRDLLFDTDYFGLATVSAKIDMKKLKNLVKGEFVRMAIESNVSLHGQSRPIPIEVVVAQSGESRLLVTSERPVVVNAPDFKLGEGVKALREIAGLPSISLAVPVSFVLAFDWQ